MSTTKPKLTVTNGFFQAITTKYLRATNCKGGRVKATTESGISETVSESVSEDPHQAAVEKLCRKLNWAGTWVGGGTREGYVWVCVDRLEGGAR